MSYERTLRTLAIEVDHDPKPRVDFEPGVAIDVGPGRKLIVSRAAAKTAKEAVNATRKRDSRRFGSVWSGCTMKQRNEFNRRFGHLGVKYVPFGETGTCRAVYDDIHAQRRVARARGYHNMDDVCGGPPR